VLTVSILTIKNGGQILNSAVLDSGDMLKNLKSETKDHVEK